MISSTAYSQPTNKNKLVPVSVLKAMGKDLEKCNKVLKPELAATNKKLDSVVIANLGIFSELKVLRIENKSYDNRLKELNQDLLKATKKKKSSWVIPSLIGLSAGIFLGVSL